MDNTTKSSFVNLNKYYYTKNNETAQKMFGSKYFKNHQVVFNETYDKFFDKFPNYYEKSY